MAIAFTYQATPEIASGTDATSYTGSSWTPPSDVLVILQVGNVQTVGAPADEPSSVTGNGLTWTKIGTSVTANTFTRVTTYGAYTSGASAGAVTVDYGASNTQRDCQAIFLTATGTDVANGVAQTFVQTVTGNGTAASSGSLTLSAASNSANRPVFATVNGTAVVAPRTNWTEYRELVTDSHILECQYRDDAFETTASWSGSVTAQFSMIASEIKAAVVSTGNFFAVW